MFCKKCGAEIGDNENFCPNCGAPNGQENGNVGFLDNPKSTGIVGIILGIVSGFSYPIAGILAGVILYYIWKDTHPAAAKGAKRCAIAAAIVWAVLLVLLVLGVAIIGAFGISLPLLTFAML